MSENAGEEEIAGSFWKRLLIRILHRYFLVARGMTLGVRAACFDETGRVFLIRHTYIRGWYMPGTSWSSARLEGSCGSASVGVPSWLITSSPTPANRF